VEFKLKDGWLLRIETGLLRQARFFNWIELFTMFEQTPMLIRKVGLFPDPDQGRSLIGTGGVAALR
jgi:hypothetical protein